MAELDYAFVADFAQVEAGKLTVVGASYTYFSPPAFPVQHSFAIAGRVRAPEETTSIDMAARIVTPGAGTPGSAAQTLEFRWQMPTRQTCHDMTARSGCSSRSIPPSS
jgi:hypothetical protein